MEMETKTIAAIVLALIIGIAIGTPVGYYLLAPTKEPTSVTLEYWTPFAGSEQTLWFWQNASDIFYNETGIRVKIVFYTGEEFWTKLAASFAAEAPPDLFTAYAGGELKSYVEEGVTANLTDLLSEDWALAQIPQGIRATVTYDGSQWALPYELQSDWPFINSRLFDQAGVAIPTMEEGWTWDEFIATCAALNASGIIPVAMSGKAKWSLSFPQVAIQERLNGPEAFNNAYHYRNQSFFDQYNRSFTKVQEWIQMGYFQEGWGTDDYMDAWGLFHGGEAAMWLQGSWAIGMSPDTENFTLDVTPWPYFPEYSNESSVKDVVFGGITNVAVASQGQHIPEAKAFLKFISRPEIIIMSIKMAANPSAQNIILPEGVYHPILAKCQDAVAASPYLAIRYGSQMSPEFADIVGEQIDKVWAMLTDPETAATAIEDAAVDMFGAVTP